MYNLANIVMKNQDNDSSRDENPVKLYSDNPAGNLDSNYVESNDLFDITDRLAGAVGEFFSDSNPSNTKDRIARFQENMYVYHSDLNARLKFLPESLSEDHYKLGLSDDRLILQAIENYVEAHDDFSGHQKEIMYAAIEGRSIDMRVFMGSDEVQTLLRLFVKEKVDPSLVVVPTYAEISEWQSCADGTESIDHELETQWQKDIFNRPEEMETTRILPASTDEIETASILVAADPELEVETAEFLYGTVPFSDHKKTVVEGPMDAVAAVDLHTKYSFGG